MLLCKKNLQIFSTSSLVYYFFFLSLSCFIFHLTLYISLSYGLPPRERYKKREREIIGARRERGEEQFALTQEIYVRWTFSLFFW
jgi:hypothetical protein